jgi:hypothetical protein
LIRLDLVGTAGASRKDSISVREASGPGVDPVRGTINNLPVCRSFVGRHAFFLRENSHFKLPQSSMYGGVGWLLYYDACMDVQRSSLLTYTRA